MDVAIVINFVNLAANNSQVESLREKCQELMPLGEDLNFGFGVIFEEEPDKPCKARARLLIGGDSQLLPGQLVHTLFQHYFYGVNDQREQTLKEVICSILELESARIECVVESKKSNLTGAT